MGLTFFWTLMFRKICLEKSGILEWLPSSLKITDQVSYKGKRFDFGVRIGKETGYLELKSAVTCEHGWASYPDAPSKRGLEHIKLLTELSSEGIGAYVVFVVTHPNCDKFRPNREIQPDIAEELKVAEKSGVGVYGLKMVLTKKGEVLLTNPDIPVSLET
ncbi:MAG: DNA/RNA nuclease SfsA [Candidatus Bipolaricaulota bacterium]